MKVARLMGMALGTMLLMGRIMVSHAENVDSLSKKYPGEMAVYTKYDEHLVIEFEKGQLVAHSDVERELLLLKDNAATYFSTGSVYHSYFNQLQEVQGYTMLPDGSGGYKTIKTKIKKTIPSESESVFYDDGKETQVDFTNLARGAKTSLKYSLFHNEIHLLPRFYFQNYIPMQEATFTITYPKGMDLESVMEGSQVTWVKKTVEENRKTVTVTWKALDVPRAKVFDDAPSFSYYSPHILVYVKSYVDPHSGETVNVLKDPDALYKYVYGFVKNVNTKEDKNIKEKVTALTKDTKTDAEKAAVIYKWVQDNVRYIAFEDSLGGFIPREAGLVFQRRFGDCKDMASLLRGMCRAAGLDARYVWIGTRSIPYSLKATPIPGLFNHMICAVKIDNKWVFLDGTDNILPYGAIPNAIQGKDALISDNAEHYETLKIPVIQGDVSMIVDSSHVRVQDEKMTGDVSIQLSGFNAWGVKAILKYKNEKEKEKTFQSITQRGSNKYHQLSFDYKVFDDPAKEVVINAGFELPGYVRKAGKDYFINMNLLRRVLGDNSDLADRTAPIERDFKEVEKQVVVLDIPKGYKVSHLPEPKHEKVEGVGSYTISYQTDGKTVTLSKELKMDALYIQPNQFKDFDSITAALQNTYKESIVLTQE
jgi:transglutaminase-like putative cysteine protease